ncbi:MAG TPA: SDR family oxidoreductase [Mycobacteriales bacterium]|nr:SDR family oxidoreductase [Mycobacteriales bacterium]
MRVFVTGATGWIGSAVVRQLLADGHEVVGLARSDDAADRLVAAGVSAHRGALDDPDSLAAGAAASDGVVHLAYIHDFAQIEAAAAADQAAIEAIGTALEDTGRPLLIASGTLGLRPDGVGTETDLPGEGHPRMKNAAITLSLADRGVRSCVVRLPPTVHGDGDHGFIARLVDIAREQGVSGYVGDGENCWSAVHVEDAATVFRLGLERAPAGSVLHAVADEGVSILSIADVIGRQLDLSVVSVAPEDAAAHFGWLGRFLAMNARASSTLTRELLGWQPAQPGLIDDLEAGHYFRAGG